MPARIHGETLMLKAIKPAVDAAVKPRGPFARGQPLSYNRAPAEDLAPWVGGLYATHVELPENYCLDGGLLSDTSFVRIQLAGHWHAQTADGRVERGRSLLVFGPNTRMMPVRVTGSFLSVGISLRPGAAMRCAGPMPRILWTALWMGAISAGRGSAGCPAGNGRPHDWLL
jgi:hypothetical protein